MVERKNYRPGQLEAETFRKMPERAQELWFQYCDMAIKNQRENDLLFLHIMGMDYSECKSPIEVIFNFAYDLICFSENLTELYLECQREIVSRDGMKKYYADFVFDTENNPEMININHDFKLVIECDGHEFHEKTKEQVTNDNERDLELKMMGYDVLRFSGSQIYNKPFRCAAGALDYITTRIKKDERS